MPAFQAKQERNKLLMKILLVEDNEMVVKGLSYSLEQNNFEVIAKTNIKDTLKFLEQEKTDLERAYQRWRIS